MMSPERPGLMLPRQPRRRGSPHRLVAAMPSSMFWRRAMSTPCTSCSAGPRRLWPRPNCGHLPTLEKQAKPAVSIAGKLCFSINGKQDKQPAEGTKRKWQLIIDAADKQLPDVHRITEPQVASGSVIGHSPNVAPTRSIMAIAPPSSTRQLRHSRGGIEAKPLRCG